jgi:hypothetical protein
MSAGRDGSGTREHRSLRWPGDAEDLKIESGVYVIAYFTVDEGLGQDGKLIEQIGNVHGGQWIRRRSGERDGGRQFTSQYSSKFSRVTIRMTARMTDS